MKKIIIAVLITLLLLFPACKRVDYDQLKMEFDALLASGDYQAANTLYTASEDERIDYYKQSLDFFVSQFIENTVINMADITTLQDAKESLNKLLIFDYTKSAVQSAIDDITIQESEIKLSEANYIDGIALFEGREFDLALEKLAQVQDYDPNYQSALNTIAILKIRVNMWEEAVENNSTGRHPYVNSLAYKNGYVYFPADIDNLHSIVRYNYETGETMLLPIIEFVGTYHIKGINVIGDYLYFIGGEEVGKGLMLETPYNIYEMKTDGTELTMVKTGDYFDLISQGNTFYALSYSKGLVKMDKDFKTEEVISDKRIIEMQVTEAGLYYTEKLENTYDTQHTLYLYNDGESREITTSNMLHVYFFDDYTVYYNDMDRRPHEEIYYADMDLGNPIRLAILRDGGSNSDILGFIGAIDDTVMINTAGWVPNPDAFLRQNIYSEITISNKKLMRYMDDKKAPPYEVLNVLYEEGAMLVLSADGVYSLTESPSQNDLTRIIDLPLYDQDLLNTNMAVIEQYRPGDSDFFSDEEVVAELEDFWYYSSPNLSVRIERIYDESIETTIFVSNIRTKDNRGFNIGYSNMEPPGDYTIGVKTDDIAQINKAVFATNGDFAMLWQNDWAGKILRDGNVFDGTEEWGIIKFSTEKVYDNRINCRDFIAMYPDGNMVAYFANDEITVGELLEAGVKDTLCFGPVLVYDSEQTDACKDIKYFISYVNPRCAWGMVEPGHYVNLVVEGRQPNVNRGISYYSMSNYFIDLGCSVAYNLDGGQTAAVAFMGRFLNTHQFDYKFTNHRPVQEIIYFGYSDLVPAELENYYEE